MSLISDMERCGQWPSCVLVFEFWVSNKKNCKKIKAFEFAKPCVNQMATNLKRKISDVEELQLDCQSDGCWDIVRTTS